MADLPNESIRRIADRRRDAESELKKATSAVAENDAVVAYLPAITSFASALFDAEAGELLAVCEDAEAFETALENEVAPRIIEGVLPDRSLNRVRERGTEEVKWLSVEYEVKTGLLFEDGDDGTCRLAGAYTLGLFAPHGAWENFMPKRVQFSLRLPNNNATVRAVLTQALQQRTDYWAGRFQVRATACGRGAPAPGFDASRDDLRRPVTELPGSGLTSAESLGTGPATTYKTAFGRNVDRLRKECGWSFDALAGKTGLEKKLILGHVNDGKGAHPRTIKTYAEAFTKKLNRSVTVAELES